MANGIDVWYLRQQGRQPGPSVTTGDVQNTPAKQSRVYGIRTGPQNREHTTVHNEMGDVILVGGRMHGEDAQFNK